MSGSKVFTVFGSTGNQGGSIIKNILAHPTLSKEYKLRGVTRNPESDRAKALTAQGVEMVAGDMEVSESVSKAIEGSYAVFGVTNYWENPSKEREVNQGKRIADACKTHGVKQLIWSNLPHVGKLSGGKYPNVHHFDGKAEIGEYIASLRIPHVNVVPGMFMQNLRSGISKSGDGETYNFAMPLSKEVKYPWFNPVKDTGAFVAGALLHPEIFDKATTGTPVSISQAGGFWSGTEVCEIFEKVTGKKTNFVQLEQETYIGFMSTRELGQELLENMLLVSDYGYFGPTVEKSIEGLEESIKEYYPDGKKPQSLEEFIVENKAAFWHL
ncbi:hypothetical protein TWF679_000559 [Orbilia oligospora]|uniref:NmrA-like domain-containing protein n=1 Tax=Orbilia oligospora TaxID=2813651 RepID=A0A8H8UXI1_ORBOL|nr:hypothetical protein TWF679_000559 [Orbilia oligospora]